MKQQRVTTMNMKYKFIMPIRLTTDEFIKKSQSIHKEENGTPIFDYTKVKYENSSTKVTIICKIHGDFGLTPNCHTSGKQGCQRCGIERSHNATEKRRSTTEEFIKKSHIQK